MTKTATLVKSNLKDFRGYASLYKLSEPIEKRNYWDEEAKTKKFSYVVVSSVNAAFSGPETLIFGADKKGNVKDWVDLDGSRRGDYSHEEVLREAGYEVVE